MSLDVKTVKAECDFGLRIELPSKLLRSFLTKTGDFNFIANGIDFHDLRYNSQIGEWDDFDLVTVLPIYVSNKRSSKVSFMMSVKCDLEESVRVSKILNVLSNDKIRKESVSEFINNGTNKYFKQFDILTHGLDILSKIIPRFNENAIIYSPEIRCGGILSVNDSMKTSCKNLYGIGHCTNKVSTIIEAMASGINLANIMRG